MSEFLAAAGLASNLRFSPDWFGVVGRYVVNLSFPQSEAGSKYEASSFPEYEGGIGDVAWASL